MRLVRIGGWAISAGFHESVKQFLMVPGVGLEPTRIAPADFKSAASANSATPAGASYFTAFTHSVSNG
jgi:hypothetical protein